MIKNAILRPLEDRVVIRRDTSETMSKGGIALPESFRSKEKPQQGVVLNVGPGRPLDNGGYSRMSVKEGDRVLFGQYAGNEPRDYAEIVVIRMGDIIAVIESTSDPEEEFT